MKYLSTIAVMLAAILLTSCGSGPTQLGGTSGDSSTVINNNNVTSGQNGSGSTLALDVVVSLPSDYVDPITGAITPITSLIWTVTVTDALRDVLPNSKYTITATFPNGSKDTSGASFSRSWSFFPSLIGSYRIDASDSSGRTAYMMKARDN